MTLATEANLQEVVADGIQTVFTVPFPFLADSHLFVFTIDTSNVPTLKVITTDYTVLGALDPTGGSVTFLVAPASGLTVRIYRWAPFTQQVDYVENDNFPAETHEQALDKLTMLVIQIAQRTGGTAFDVGKTNQIQLVTNDLGLWDAQSLIITNVGDPLSPQDAATKAFVTAQITGSGNVPAPLVSEIGFVLTVLAADSFDWVASAASIVPVPADPADDKKHISALGGVYVLRTPAESRTDLLLKAAALETVGVAIGDLFKLVDVGGNAALPVLDGSNLTGVPASVDQNSLVIIRDEKATGTAGGTFTAGAYQTRVLNTEVHDPGGHATLAANQITLAAGTWRAKFRCPAFRVNRHRSRLRNITDATVLVLGANATADQNNVDQSDAPGEGVFAIAAAKVLELQHRSQTSRTGDGFGNEMSFGDTEIYSEIVFEKLA